ncbi:MAG: hydroxymethylglutaryl-CoA lyase [Pseudomonadota bacterium]
MTGRVEIYEVGPRDGLQNEPRQIPIAEKIALVEALGEAGFKRIEMASFVSPKWVPQMAGSAGVFAGMTRRAGVSYVALAPNVRGYQDAMAAGADEVAVFLSASEGFSRANLNASIDDSFDRAAEVAACAEADGTRLRAYVSCVVECPFEGPVAPTAVAHLVTRLRAIAAYEVSLGDTIGKGTPETIDAMLAAVLDEIEPQMLAGHYHDTNGRALENIEVSLSRGLRVFDASVGGLGGCPYAPGAAGNVASEDVNARLLDLGFQTGLDQDGLVAAADMARAMRGP